MSRPVGRTILLTAGVGMAFTVVAAIWVMGGPGSQRDRRMDERRIDDLRALQEAITQHHAQAGRLPANLLALGQRPGLDLAVSDPVSRTPYGYHIDAADRYRLCAQFATDTAVRQPQRRAWNGYDLQWAHGAGATCFDRRIDTPDRPGTP